MQGHVDAGTHYLRDERRCVQHHHGAIADVGNRRAGARPHDAVALAARRWMQPESMPEGVHGDTGAPRGPGSSSA